MENKTAHVDIKVPDEVEIFSLVIYTSSGIRNSLLLPLSSAPFKKLVDQSTPPKRNKTRDDWNKIKSAFVQKFLKNLENFQPSTINHQPSTINHHHQPSTITIHHQPSTTNHQPSTITINPHHHHHRRRRRQRRGKYEH